MGIRGEVALAWTGNRTGLPATSGATCGSSPRMVTASWGASRELRAGQSATAVTGKRWDPGSLWTHGLSLPVSCLRRGHGAGGGGCLGHSWPQWPRPPREKWAPSPCGLIWGGFGWPRGGSPAVRAAVEAWPACSRPRRPHPMVISCCLGPTATCWSFLRFLGLTGLRTGPQD